MRQSRHEAAIRAEIERIEGEITETDSGITALTERRKGLEGQRATLQRILDNADSGRGGEDNGGDAGDAE